MRMLTVSCVGLLAFSGVIQLYADSDAKIRDLEKRISRIEQDLYKIDERASSKRVNPIKLAPAKAVAPNVVEVRLNAFLKEYAGVAFGDDFYAVHPEETRKDIPSNWFLGPFQMRKRFRWMTQYHVRICLGKIVSIKLCGRCDGKYSTNATRAELEKIVDEINLMIGSNARIENNAWCHFNSNLPAYPRCFYETNYVKFECLFENPPLENELKRQADAIGNELPPIPTH